MAFCDALSRREGRRYRLPTEAEWEYVCRAGTTTNYATGDSLTREQANFGRDRGKERGPLLKPVGSHAANAWGVFDLHGNVNEWVADWYDAEYYLKSPGLNPPGPTAGKWRVIRGGSVLTLGPRRCYSAYRQFDWPETRASDLGFRVVLEE